MFFIVACLTEQELDIFTYDQILEYLPMLRFLETTFRANQLSKQTSDRVSYSILVTKRWVNKDNFEGLDRKYPKNEELNRQSSISTQNCTLRPIRFWGQLTSIKKYDG